MLTLYAVNIRLHKPVGKFICKEIVSSIVKSVPFLAQAHSSNWVTA